MEELKGSEKQVAWATKIRREMITSLTDRLNGKLNGRLEATKEMIKEKGKDGMLAMLNSMPAGKKEAAISKWNQIFEEIDKLERAKTETSAKWFIENR